MKKKIARWKEKIPLGIYPTCVLCGKLITSVKELSVEHIKPISRGGSDDDTNLYPSHKKCNFEKGNMTLREYVNYLRQKEKE